MATRLCTVLVFAITISFLFDWYSSASPDENDGEKDWWTGTAIWKAWRNVGLLNKTLPRVSTNTTAQDQTGSDWLRNIWVGIAAASSLTTPTPPLSPVWPMSIPAPKLDLGSLFKMPSTLSPDLGIFRKIWDEILRPKPAEPYDDSPSNPQEVLEKAKQEEGKIINPGPGGPLHQQGKREAAEWLRQQGEKDIEFEKDFRTPYGTSYADVESENYVVEVKTRYEPMPSSRMEDFEMRLKAYMWAAEQKGKTAILYIVNNPLKCNPYAMEWETFIDWAEQVWGVKIVHGSGW